MLNDDERIITLLKYLYSINLTMMCQVVEDVVIMQ
jgi:hypothetical protein